MYKLSENQKFLIEGFQQLQPFSSFLPGIAGVNGTPMWVFYVSRGQGIASFGIQDKDHAIMEFLPADKSYQLVPLQGFRTFIKIIEETGISFLEPFSPQDKSKKDIKETMIVSENMLELEYINSQVGLKMKVEYLILPEAPVAGLVRHISLINLSDKTLELEVLDGLPAILPSGVPNQAYKELGNTLKSWFDVTNLEKDIPFYHLRGSIEDSSEVKEVKNGNFYFSTTFYRNNEQLVKPIIDRDIIFGSDTSLQVPSNFVNERLAKLLEHPQYTTNKVSCGFSGSSFELMPKEDFEMFTVVGHANNLDQVQTYVENNLNQTNLLTLLEKANSVTKELTNKVATKTGQPLFDAYARQSFLDNGLRGGFPVVFENNKKKKIYYLYSRKHGDLERDYNFFSISPTYYSQGNGNYRDINQNRRCDIFFEPKVEDYSVRLFMNLIQLDGYNPLVVKGVRFLSEKTITKFVSEGKEKLQSFFENSFTPGELKQFIESENIQLTVDFETYLTDVLLNSEELFQAEFGEGYWIDHWTYNLDLVDSYLSIYPDKEKEFYFNCSYQFFESPVRVKRRDEKYLFSNGNLRQYHAIEKIKEKMKQADHQKAGSWIKKNYGDGEIYKTTLYSKMFLLALVKTATMAPLGLGIEMEADKPGWNDSLNGLPGMFGASTSELFELKRLIEQLLVVEKGEEVRLPIEGADFLSNVVNAIKEVDPSCEKSEHRYWNQVTSYRENYRETIYEGISGKEVIYSFEDTKAFLTLLKEKVEKGLERVHSYGTELVSTYFYFEPKAGLNMEKLDISTIEWQPKAVTPFLESIVKSLKLTKDKKVAKKLYDKVRTSDIYDKKLNMYKTSMSIKDEPIELGRAKSFTPGWLENESIFLHMEYKYLLATLKIGLAEEFFDDMKKALIPFLDPKVYGRSTLENSSFIASSANPNPELHGRGFVSRLSGSTIEFMNMWFVMMAGKNPFMLENSKLVCQLVPILPSWMFDENGQVSFMFLGTCQITYLNPRRLNTYGEDAVLPVEYSLTYQAGETLLISDNVIKGQHAEDVRTGLVTQITVKLN